ncbi:MAG: hypothetical protein ACLP0L_27605 [Solirubrobacteraceae bacterium]
MPEPIAMRRLIIVLQLLLAALLVGAAPAPAARDSSVRAPALRVLDGTLRWNRLPGVRSYVVAVVDAPTTKYRVVRRTRFAPWPTRGHTVAYRVRARVDRARWSRVVRLSWPAREHTTEAGAQLKVSVENTTGWGVDSIFRNIGVRYERLEVGNGGNLDQVTQALSDGMTPLVLYDPGPHGSLRGVAPARAAAQIVSLAQQLSSLAATYPSLAQLGAIEFGNEAYIYENAARYAAQYDAAHRALAANGLSSWKLLANATAVCGDYHAEDWIPEVVGGMSAGPGEIDGWSVHPYGPMGTDSSSDCSGPHGFGWPDVRNWHQIAVNSGSYAPWYVTEVGQCVSAGSACPNIVDPATQAADMTRYLDQAATYPWLVFFNWYTSCDDSSGGYGLLTENSAHVCGQDGPSDRRPAFTALARWIAAHGQG